MKIHQKDRLSIDAAPPTLATPLRLSSLIRLWPVRLLIYFAALMLMVILTKLLSLPFVPASSSPTYIPIVTLRNILQALAMVAAYSLLVRKLENRKAYETAVSGAATSLLTGVAIGVGLIALVYLVLYGLGIAHFHAGTGLSDISTAILKPTVIGVLEELVFRVILFRIVQHMAGTFLAVVISSILFGLAHVGNPGATSLAITFLAVEMGAFLALVYVVTRSLWLVAGSHMGWNFALGSIFGSGVSGLASSSSIIKTTLQGPPLLTGGAFGLEGSIVTLGVSLIAIFVTVRLINRGNLWRPIRLELQESRLPKLQ